MRILFIDHSTRLQTVVDLERHARGGMVSSLFQISDYLSNQGHDVTVWSDIRSAGATRAGTKWLQEVWGEYDALICNRGVGDGYPGISARKRFLWTHDLPHAGFIPDPDVIRGFACTVFMSAYAERIWRTYYREIGKSVVIPNGVDRNIFFPRYKDPNYLIFASAPNRGLERLPLIFEALREATGKSLKLKAFSRLAVLHPNEGPDQFDYEPIRASKVQLCDPIPQKDFANELGQAGLMILPSGYPEICSNIILQALASGTPVITTGGLGSAPEWIRPLRNGMLTSFQPHDYMVYSLEVIRAARDVLMSQSFHERLIEGAANTKVPTWQTIGAKWERMLNRYC